MLARHYEGEEYQRSGDEARNVTDKAPEHKASHFAKLTLVTIQ